jgi:phage/conjugal plasmid C-4 type zinc finger TraR family protein
MIDKEFEYNNEEEAEMAQIHSIHLHMNAVANVQRQLEKQRQMVSAEDCVECGEPIPEARRLAVPGVQLCIYCKSKSERV